VSGRGAALVASSLLDGGAEGPVRLSTPLDGAYGIEGVPLSVPVTPTARGVGEMRERELSPGEREGLREAAGAVRRGT
jgi:malate dehydrogenase